MTDQEVPDDLRELAVVARAGDPRARERLMRTVRPLVCRWAVVWTGDADEAEDVAQEALIRIDRGLARYEPTARFTTWAYRVVHNVVRDRGRRTRREARARAAVAREPAERGDGVHAGLDRRRLLAMLRQWSEALSPRQRAAFDLVDLQGIQPAEAAEMLSINASTLRVHLMRARRALRETWIKTREVEKAHDR